jgi:mannose-6-phosphate isomerase-like protein (cupin superfamily)
MIHWPARSNIRSSSPRRRELSVTRYHHRRLPAFSTLLSGHTPPDDFGFASRKLQIWYNNTLTGWKDDRPHAHQESDECFIVLEGTLVVDVEGERVTISPGEFCCFPAGVFHAVVDVHLPAETMMIRAPSVDDKLYP